MGCVYLACLALFLFVTLLLPLFINVHTDSPDDKNGFNIFTKYMTVGTFMGLIFGLLIYGLYMLFFRNLIYEEMKEVKSAIHKIDTKILSYLQGLSEVIDQDMVTFLYKKGKDNSKGAYQKFNQYIMQAYTKNDNTDMIVKLIMFFTLYSHLYDNIPDTNSKAINLIPHYFFKAPLDNDFSSITEEDIRKGELTYISLMTESKGITQIKKIYEELDFYKLNSAKDIEIKRKLDEKINELNEMIVSFPEFNNSAYLIGVYMFLMFLIATAYLLMYNYVIKKGQREINNALEVLTSATSAIIAYVIPIAGELESRLDHPEIVSQCTKLSNEIGNAYHNQKHKCIMDKTPKILPANSEPLQQGPIGSFTRTREEEM